MQISHLQVTDAKSWKGLTTDTHLGSIWNVDPQRASELVTKIQQRNMGMDVASFLKKYPKKMFKGDQDFIWDLESVGVDNIGLIECRIDGTAITAADQVGINNTQFELVFPKDWFSQSETIVGHKNERYPIRILEPGRAEGTNTVYVCEFYTGDQNDFIPYEELVAGKLFSREYALAERTLSQTGREIQFKSNITMRNTFSRIRIKKETPGNMKDKELVVQMVNEAGKKFYTWYQYEAYKLDLEFRNDINRLLMFGKSNRTPNGNYTQKGVSGYEMSSGAGLREQCETSNYSAYTTFDIDDLIDRLIDMSEDKLGIDERSFVMCTGERGTLQFHKALEEYSQLFTPNKDNARIYSASMNGIKMAKGYGGQFVEFTAFNGIDLKLSIMGMYDDKTRNKEIHPDGGVTESYRYDIWDFGTQGGEANIQLCGVEGSLSDEIHVYIPGLRDPFSISGGAPKMVVNPKDGWEEHKMWQGGVMVKDPTKTAHFVYNG